MTMNDSNEMVTCVPPKLFSVIKHVEGYYDTFSTLKV